MSVPNCKALSTTGHPPKGGNELTHTYYHCWRKALGQFPRLKYLSYSMGGLGPLPSFWDLVIQVLNEWVPRKREDKKEAISVKQTSTRCVKNKDPFRPGRGIQPTQMYQPLKGRVEASAP